MTSWKVAGALDQLLDQLNALAPHRSKASDGSIGDAAHAARDSDHDPWWVLAGQAYVTARDYTHDPAGGLDCQWLANALQAGHDQRVKYVIWNRQIMAGAGGPSPWIWRPYGGANGHTHHLHLSVVPDARSLVRIPWQLTATPSVLAGPARDEVDMASIEELRALIHAEVPAAVWQATVPDYYPATPDGQAPPTMPAWAALAWGTTHAAHARDEAGGAHGGVAELAKRIAAGSSAVSALTDGDLHRVAAAVLDEQARRLTG